MMHCTDGARTVKRRIQAMSNFWERKREELQREGVIPAPKPSVVSRDGPWWADPGNHKTAPVQEAQRPLQPREGESRQLLCPHCHSDNYMKPSSSVSARCFDCGYTSGRQLNELELPGIASPDATRLKVKQLPSQGHFGRSVAEINANNAALEQSAHGKTKIG